MNVNGNDISIEISASSEAAAQAIDKLTASLKRLRTASNSIPNLSGVATKIRELADAARETEDSYAALGRAAETLERLSNIRGIVIPKSIGDGIRNIGLAAESVTPESVSNLDSMTRSLQRLSSVDLASLQGLPNLQFPNVPENAGAALQSIANAAAQITSDQFKNLDQFTSYLQRLANVDLEHLSDALNRINRTKVKIKVDSSQVDKASKGVSKLSKFLSSLKRIAFYRLIRTALKEIGDMFNEGMENAYWYSKNVGGGLGYIAESFDKLSSASFKAQNQLGAAAATLKVALIPVFTQIVQWITKAADALTQFFAVLNGKTTYMKAADYTKAAYENTEKGAKAAKEWKNQLMGFDEINRLDGLSDATKAATSTTPDYENMFTEESIDDTVLNRIAEKVRQFVSDIISKFRELGESINFEPLKESFGRLRESFSNLWDSISPLLQSLWDKVLAPLAKWVIEEAAPASVDLLASAFKLLSTVIDALKPAFDWLWDNVLEPLAEWTGDLFISALETATDLLNDLADLISGKTSFKEFLDQLTPIQEVLLAISTAVIAVNTAVGIFNGVVAIATAVAGGFSAAIAFITSPIGIAIVVITALIGIGILLYKHWDEIKEWLGNTWEKIKEMATAVFTPIKDFFKDTWDSISTTAKETWDSIGKFFTDLWESMKKGFNGFINFITGIFSADWQKAWQGIVDLFTNIWEGITGAFKNVANTVIGIVEGFINSIISGVNFVLAGISSVVSDVSTLLGMEPIELQLKYVTFPRFASGGFPEDGLFFANSNELVGRFTNGKTAVANNEQIVEGIERGVKDGNIDLINVMLASTVQIVDAIRESGGDSPDWDSVARTITRYQRQQTRAANA